jgi:hypothetical protein
VPGPRPLSQVCDSTAIRPARRLARFLNTFATLNSQAGAEIEFTGHGYPGTIGAGTMLANPSACTGGAFGQDFVTITITPS